ncbi:hypothetical protein [Paenibacillus thermotolerans]|uniref:hypothetical protein n=1 Tax=Paenibacillus thermotolerans TaxID=3027807 RepID=UPI002368D4DA|nr:MULTISPECIES: hypothetical protein [unclassified Paenibacillus]
MSEISRNARFQEEEALNDVWREYVETVKRDEQRKEQLIGKKMSYNGKEMIYDYFVIGEKPEGGYPLYIALHGGGSVPKEFNDRQWERMKSYYRDSVDQGIYVAARGIEDVYNTHSLPESFPLYDRLIENMIALMDADPNRVYIVGFSAGGDGVYQIAPRMADRFAAANMSAGHHNGISPRNLYNLPFLLQMGENDTAYNRHLEAPRFAGELDRLQREAGGGYPHDIFLHKDMPHNFPDNDAERKRNAVLESPAEWLKGNASGTVLKNTNAVDFLKLHARDPYPAKVVWDVSTRAELRSVKSWYWLRKETQAETGSIVAGYDRSGNRITIESAVPGGFTVLLNGHMVDLSKPVIVDVMGEEHVIAIRPSTDIMKETAYERGDPNYIFSAGITVASQDGKWVVESL